MKRLDLNMPTASETSSQNEASSQTEAVDFAQSPSNQTPSQIGLESQPKMHKVAFKWVIITLSLSIIFGSLTGYGAHKLWARNRGNTTAVQSGTIQQLAKTGQIKVGDTFGSEDAAFKDSAEGYLEAGGIDGEGSHKLLRPGGVSQTVYLTSSVTDLDKFIGMNVKVYGETYQGQKAGWLMDVGRVKVINPQGKKPAAD